MLLQADWSCFPHLGFMQAVAGIVGHAELLCASLSIPGMLLYFAAADSDAAPHSVAASPSMLKSSLALATAVHWSRVILAVLLSWAAALSKEIGITIIGCMLAYDVLLVPLTVQWGNTAGRRHKRRKNAGSHC